ncbi:MAG: hypothetical protein BWY34_00026 [Parcubacteria group bacterium ADurb.Bin247]|jgi:hypothetical protein|nr:MAG: hypothetical protein BWY34_00026 [Parcubacteria group bacterium ADurb.Bin247]HQB84926.1 hypothetical protein [Candidatus Pacearchaeota archaeon]
MQIFEFQFNPRIKTKKVENLFQEFESSERNLYIIGEQKRIVPGNEKFLTNIIRMIKDEYALNEPENHEKALQECLIKINEYFKIEIARNNTGWIGNLNLVIVSQDQGEIHLAKIGKSKIYLLKYENHSELNNKDKKTSSFFGSIISGKMVYGDRLCIVSEELQKIVEKKKILEKISKTLFLDQKTIDEIIDPIKKDLEKSSGTFFLLDNKNVPKKKSALLEEIEVDFSIKELYYNIKRIANKKTLKIDSDFKNILKPLIALGLILLVGSFIFGKKEKEIAKDINIEERLVQIDITKEESLPLLDALYKETEAKEVQNIIDSLAKIERVDEIKKIKEFEKDIKGIFLNNYGYSDNLVISDKEYKSNLPIDSIFEFQNRIILFSKPNKLLELKNNQISEIKQIEKNNIDNLTPYLANIYFTSGQEIIKYNLDSYNNWLKSPLKQPTDIISMSVDGHIWILQQGNQISKYYLGEHLADINFDIFPSSKNFIQILTSSQTDYLFVLDSSHNRIIVLDKNGKLVKQIWSEKFNNLKQIQISDNKLYILNSNTIYETTI